MKPIDFPLMLIGIMLCMLTPVTVQAAVNNNTPLSRVNINLHDKAALQRGAAFYMNYCSGCHSLHYMRYSRMAQDLGMTDFTGALHEDLLYNNLIFTEAKVHDPIEISMPAEDARQWFGIAPPDLSLITREHSVNWVYTFLKSFYADDTRPFGANNALVPGTAMPNVLEPLSGRIIAARADLQNPGPLRLVTRGEMDMKQLDRTLVDLVTFLSYVGEPVQLVRYKVGVGVLLYLALFLLIAWQLKRVYWNRLKKQEK